MSDIYGSQSPGCLFRRKGEEEKTAGTPLFNPAKGKQAKPDSPGIERSHFTMT